MIKSGFKDLFPVSSSSYPHSRKTLVYRRYASLYFATLVDSNENALLALNTIHSVVEGLDRYFQNVTELDLIFNFWKVSPLMILFLDPLVSTFPSISWFIEQDSSFTPLIFQLLFLL